MAYSKEKMAEYHKAYYEANKEKITEYNKEWVRRNRDKWNKQLRDRRKRLKEEAVE